MKFTANIFAYITYNFFLLPHASALIELEPEQLGVVSQASFVETETAETDYRGNNFVSVAEVPSFATSTLENLGVNAASVKVDERSGKPVSLDLKYPILPGDGVGNGLLWSVGGGFGAPSSSKEWEDVGVEAVKVNYFKADRPTVYFMIPPLSYADFFVSPLLVSKELDDRSPNRLAN